VRVRPRPTSRRSAGVRFPSFLAGAEAVRALAQSGLRPSNCRLIDPLEARYTGAADGTAAILVLGFESAGHDVGSAFEQAAALCRELGGEVEEREDRSGAEGAWRGAFLRAPYLRDTFVAVGVLSDTFETAITWERFPSFHEQVLGAAREAAGEGALVSCRFTHVYPDGPAPYYTVLAPARRGDEVDQWAEIKSAASDALIAAGGTITHHHAVGRDHRPWYDRQRPEPFAAALAAAKNAVDPGGVMNPGALVD
jgi:alkyldihydroxyacetonephosphate synthase